LLQLPLNPPTQRGTLIAVPPKALIAVPPKALIAVAPKGLIAVPPKGLIAVPPKALGVRGDQICSNILEN